MNTRSLRRYIDDLLRGRRPKPFRPDDFEAAQIRTAIDLQASRQGSDAPSDEFLSDLHRRLAAQQDGVGPSAPKLNATRRTRHRRHIGRRGGRGCRGIHRPCADRRQSGRGRRPGADADRRALDTGGGQRRRDRRRHAALRSRLRHRVRSSRRTANPKPYRACAPTRAADCGSTRPTTDCAARATRRRSRLPARC